MPLWQRLVIVGVVLLATIAVARLVARPIDRLVIPNEKLASDTIRNSTIRSREKVAEISLQVPLGRDLGAVVDRLRTLADGAEAFVSDLSGNATVVVRVPASDETAAERAQR